MFGVRGREEESEVSTIMQVIHCDDQVLARVRDKVDNCLVDDIHQDSWQVCNQENICTFFRHIDIYCIISP